MGKFGIFENQNLRKIFTKGDLRNHFQKSNKKKTKNATWPKGGHANHAAGGLEYELALMVVTLTPGLSR